MDAAGRPESGRCRSSRIRALPVVTNARAAARPTASNHTEGELALGPEHRPRDGDKWGTARRQPRCRSDDRFLERRVRGEHWQRELELGWAPPVVPNLGVAGRPESGRCRSSRNRALPVVPLPATTRKASWRLDRSTDRETAIGRRGRRPVGIRVAGAMTDFGSGECGANTGNASWSLVGRRRWSRMRALPVVTNTGAAGRHEHGRRRLSRIRALPVVPLPATTRKASWRLGPEHRPRDGDKWRTACRQPSCCSDDRFWERKVRGEDWERELELGLALPVDPNPGATGGPEYGRCCRSSRIRALPVVANPSAAGRPTASDHTEIELALGPEHRPRDGDK